VTQTARIRGLLAADQRSLRIAARATAYWAGIPERCAESERLESGHGSAVRDERVLHERLASWQLSGWARVGCARGMETDRSALHPRFTPMPPSVQRTTPRVFALGPGPGERRLLFNDSGELSGSRSAAQAGTRARSLSPSDEPARVSLPEMHRTTGVQPSGVTPTTCTEASPATSTFGGTLCLVP